MQSFDDLSKEDGALYKHKRWLELFFFWNFVFYVALFIITILDLEPVPNADVLNFAQAPHVVLWMCCLIVSSGISYRIFFYLSKSIGILCAVDSILCTIWKLILLFNHYSSLLLIEKIFAVGLIIFIGALAGLAIIETVLIFLIEERLVLYEKKLANRFTVSIKKE